LVLRAKRLYRSGLEGAPWREKKETNETKTGLSRSAMQHHFRSLFPKSFFRQEKGREEVESQYLQLPALPGLRHRKLLRDLRPGFLGHFPNARFCRFTPRSQGVAQRSVPSCGEDDSVKRAGAGVGVGVGLGSRQASCFVSARLSVPGIMTERVFR